MVLGRVLGIDYGDRRVGTAVSDENRIFAQTLSTIQRKRNGDGQVVDSLRELISKHHITEIVVGWPLRLNGREGIQTQKVGQFIRLLDHFKLPIHRWDERLSTMSADRVLSEGRVHGPQRRQLVDQVAAVIILQGWLDAQQSGPHTR